MWLTDEEETKLEKKERENVQSKTARPPAAYTASRWDDGGLTTGGVACASVVNKRPQKKNKVTTKKSNKKEL